VWAAVGRMARREEPGGFTHGLWCGHHVGAGAVMVMEILTPSA
jgi:hypothetical protein